MDEFSGLSVSQKLAVEKGLLDSVGKSLNALHNAERAYQENLAGLANSGSFNRPTADISISGTQTQVPTGNTSINQSNENSGDDAMSVQSVINLEDEFNSDGQPEADEELNETQTEIEINQTGDAATRDEPDLDDDGPTIINFEEFEAQFLDNPNIHDTVAEGSLSEESMNISNIITESDGEFNGNVEAANSNESNPNDYNFEIGHSQDVNSIETNSVQQSDAMLIDDDEINNEQDQDDEPTIIVVNYEEFDFGSIQSSVTRESAFGGSSNEEMPNMAEPDGDFVETRESSQGHSEQQSEAMMVDGEENIDEASNEQDQNGPTIVAVSYPASTLTRGSARVFAASVNSVVEQQDISNGTRKGIRSIGRSGKATVPKQTRNVPSSEVLAEFQQQVYDESESAQPDLNTFESTQDANKKLSDARMIDDIEIIHVEIMDESENEQSQDGPTIIVNYEEFVTLSIGSTDNQDTAAESWDNEESMNITEPDGEFNGNVENANLNENESEQESAAVNDANSEQDQAGPRIALNPVSTPTRRSTRAVKTVNYVEPVEDSFADQKVTLTGTRKRKRSIRRSGKSNAPKRTENVPVQEVAAQLVPQVNDDSEEDENDESESEDILPKITVRRLKCRVPDCKKMLKNKAQLNSHLLAKHSIEKYACKVKDCTESYATRGELKVHRDSVHDHLGTNWSCGQCETTCTSYQNLYKHFYLNHEEGQFACSADKCNYIETTRQKVKTHRQMHRPVQYCCTFEGCTSSFYNQILLTRHFRVHTKEKPFLCSQCPKAFSRNDTLTAHMLIHSGLKPYSCTWPDCGYSAHQQSSVISHVRTVHFHLPQTKKEQTEKNIIDDRDPRVFMAKTVINGN